MSIARIFVPICVNCVYCVNCTKFVQLILRIGLIIKIDVTRCQILRRTKCTKCTKIVFGWGSAPDPLGELTTLPQTAGRLGGDRRIGSLSILLPSALASVLPYHLYVRGAASVCVYCVNCTKFGQLYSQDNH